MELQLIRFLADISDFGAKMQWYKYLLGELPIVHYSTLKRVISHLARYSTTSFVRAPIFDCLKKGPSKGMVNIMYIIKTYHLLFPW